MIKKLPSLIKPTLALFVAISLMLFSLGCSEAKNTPPAESNADEQTTATDSDVAITTLESSDASTDEQSYKYVAFTFDDGPHSEITKKVVDTLTSYGGRATFFVVGDRIDDKSAQIIKYASSHGNEIGMHSFTHKNYFDKCDDETYEREIKYTRNRLSSYAGVQATLLRPPGGLMTAERVSSSQYPIILWSVDSLDWKHKTTESEQEKAQNVEVIVDNVLSQVKDGDIILMHDIYENTYLAFRIIAEQLYNDGYRFVTVSELLGDSIRSGAKFHSTTVN